MLNNMSIYREGNRKRDRQTHAACHILFGEF